ncbi:unnamed protein product, partial [marine sediment metagenome]
MNSDDFDSDYYDTGFGLDFGYNHDELFPEISSLSQDDTPFEDTPFNDTPFDNTPFDNTPFD